jgi:hypothetical protein
VAQVCLAFLLGGGVLPAPLRAQQKYSFMAGECTVSLTTRPLAPFVGKPLKFASMRRRWRQFVGSINMVAIRSSDARGRACNFILRERTTIEKQRADLPARPPFESAIRLVHGRAADLQVFGFDLGTVPEDQRERAREQFLGATEIVNQELFANNAETPFAVLTWRRSDRDILIIRTR